MVVYLIDKRGEGAGPKIVLGQTRSIKCNLKDFKMSLLRLHLTN